MLISFKVIGYILDIELQYIVDIIDTPWERIIAISEQALTPLERAACSILEAYSWNGDLSG